MALLHRAEIRPEKLELLAGWLPARPWYRGPAAPDLRKIAAYRFDDPAGEVGIEGIIVRAGDGPLLHATLTYRAAPLEGAEPWLVGTTEHSVLGSRWVYDACGDPVFAGVLARTILTGAGQAEQLIDIDGRLERREPSMSVRSSGTGEIDASALVTIEQVTDGDPTRILTGTVELGVVRVLGETGGPDAGERLTGAWTDHPEPLLLAWARAR